MNSPKRKVTDLLPTEAILISSDADLKVLDEFEKECVRWSGGQSATEFNPVNHGFEYPFYLFYKNNQLSWADAHSGIPATDFIPTEAEKVEVDDTVLLSDVRNKLTPIKNLIAMLESGFIAPTGSFELIYKELKQCKINIAELTRNPETK